MRQSLAVLMSVTVVAAAIADVPPVSIDALFGTNRIRSAELSPDGQKVAFLAPSQGTYGLALLDLATRKVTNPIHIEGENINYFFWKGNDHIIFSGIIDGNEGGPQVASTDLAGKRVFSIVKPQTTKLSGSIYQGGVVSTRKGDPGHIYIFGLTLDKNYSDGEHTIQMSAAGMIIKASVLNGDRTLVCPTDDGDASSQLESFGVDHEGAVRTGYRSTSSSTEFIYRDKTTDPWKTVRKFRANFEGWDVAGFTGDDSGVYIIDHESSDVGALRVFDPSTGTLGPALFTPEDGEIGDLIFSPDEKRLIGVQYTTEKRHIHWFEPKFAGVQAKLDNTFKGVNVVLVSISDDENRLLLRTYSDRDLGAFYLVDLAKGSLGLVTPAGPAIIAANMAPMLPIAFPARDGLTIHGYLTLPLSHVSGTPGPLIIHPHGGPFGIRDEWGFDPEVQLLANRGYAVLQINYRGSGGYGSSFLHAGYREWGGKMQDDLSDGVKWVIDKGYADPKRVAIFGASYGGYATLAGLVYTPELYKCGINYVGVTDLVELTRRKGEGESLSVLSYYNDTIGADRQFLYDHSPVNFVERIRVPLLNAYGENDQRVDIAQWDELKSQLDKYHKDYDFMIAKGEGHGFRHVEDAVTFYTKVDEFLKKNL